MPQSSQDKRGFRQLIMIHDIGSVFVWEEGLAEIILTPGFYKNKILYSLSTTAFFVLTFLS